MYKIMYDGDRTVFDQCNARTYKLFSFRIKSVAK